MQVNSGFGYAVSINQIKNFFHALRGGRVVDHATLGATVGTDDHGRVVVRDILGESDAYRRGLQVDDEVVSLAERPITSVNEFKNVLGTLPSNWRVPLVVNRGTERMELLVRLSGQHGSNWDFPTHGQPQPPVRVRPVPKKPDDKKLENPEEKKPDEGKPGEEEAPEEEPPGDPKPAEGQSGEDKPEERGPEPKAPDNSPPAEPKPEEKSPAPAPLPAQPKPENKPGLIEKRPGFANFVFNRKEQERVFSAFSAFHRKKGDLPAAAWQVEGKVGQVPFLARLKDDAGMLKIGESDFVVGKEDLMSPAGDDGIAVLRGFMLWRSFMLKGKDAFPDTCYDGRAPTPFGLCDVLVSTFGPIRVTWYVLPDTGSLQVAEVCFERSTDPYEFLVGKYEEHDGLLLPGVIFIRVGDDLIGKFTVTDYDLGKPGEEPKEPPPSDPPK
jgi:hypothetical protein